MKVCQEISFGAGKINACHKGEKFISQEMRKILAETPKTFELRVQESSTPGYFTFGIIENGQKHYAKYGQAHKANAKGHASNLIKEYLGIK